MAYPHALLVEVETRIQPRDASISNEGGCRTLDIDGPVYSISSTLGVFYHTKSALCDTFCSLHNEVSVIHVPSEGSYGFYQTHSAPMCRELCLF